MNGPGLVETAKPQHLSFLQETALILPKFNLARNE